MLLKSLIQRRSIESAIGNASAYAKWLLQYEGSTASGARVSEHSAEALPVVHACINVLAQTLAHVPLEILQETGNGIEKAKKHPLWKMVGLQPNPDQTSYTFRETLEGHRNGWGNAYAEIVRVGGRVLGLQIHYPDRTTPHRIEDGTLVYLVNDDSRGQRVVPAVDMLHFAGRGFDGCKGYSPIHIARETVGLGLAIHQYGASFFGNGASPKGIIESEVPSNTLAPFIEEFKKNYGGLDQAHGTPILPKGLTYKPTSINPDDAQTLETLKYNRTEICGIYRVPPQFVMDLERSTFTNAVEMDLHFVKHTMIPIFTNWEQELNKKLLTDREREQGYFFRFDVRGLLRGAAGDRYGAYHTALQDGWMSRNEVRQMEDLPTEDGLSEFLVPNNMVAPGMTPAESVDLEPLARSIAERMAANERKSLARNGADPAKMAEFYQKFPDFIIKTALPTAKMLQNSLNSDAETFCSRFAERYIARVMAQEADSFKEITVDEEAIMAVFSEVLNEHRA